MQDDKKNSQKMKKVISKPRKTVLLTAFTPSMALCLGPLIHPLPAAERREVRELKKCDLKLAISGCSLLFNGACLRENVPPNYSYYSQKVALLTGKEPITRDETSSCNGCML